MKIANADKLKKHFENVVDVHLFTPAEIITIIDTFSSEVPEGEWSQCNFHDLGGFGDWDYKCSKCNKVNGWKANYCPNCGARMKRSPENKLGGTRP